MRATSLPPLTMKAGGTAHLLHGQLWGTPAAHQIQAGDMYPPTRLAPTRVSLAFPGGLANINLQKLKHAEERMSPPWRVVVLTRCRL